jgi:predicted phage terminase large subunit-like protein
MRPRGRARGKFFGLRDKVVQSWDTANKPAELSDYSVCATWGFKGSSFYLLNVFRKRLSYPDLKRAVHQQADAFNPTAILIEDKASGTQLIQDLLVGGLSKVVRYKPEGDKITRLHGVPIGFLQSNDLVFVWRAVIHGNLCKQNYCQNGRISMSDGTDIGFGQRFTHATASSMLGNSQIQ